MSSDREEAEDGYQQGRAGLESAAAQVETATRIVEAVSRGEGAEVVTASLSGGAEAAQHTLHALGIQDDRADAVLGAIGATVEAFEGLERGVREIVSMVERARAVDHAMRFAFCTADDPEGRWLVRELEMHEPLGRPYRARITLVNEDLDALPESLLGRSASLRLSRGEQQRWVHGIVSRVEHGDRDDRALTVIVELVPALAALAHGVQSRVLQDKNVPEILEELLPRWFEQYGREAFVDVGAAPRREYCVQHQETDLDFFHRLLEEEGLTYYFEHPDEPNGLERLYVVDANHKYPAAPLSGTHALFVSHRGHDLTEADPVFELRVDERIGITDVVVSHFDWTRIAPRPDIADAERCSNQEESSLRESYEHDGRVTLSGYDVDARTYAENDLGRQALLRHQAHRLERRTFVGHSAVLGFAAGHVFKLLGHPDGGLDVDYLLVDVVHRGRDARIAHELREDRGEGEGPIDFQQTFRCVPAKGAYRPARTTPKPRIHGIQSAIVVGRSEDDIHTDEHGRIRIQFHWDRDGQMNEESTCWVRCVQQWAGEAHGAMWIPRVGSEVAVTFLDGDPDRPVVIGCLYNGANQPWQDMPTSKTRSGWRTRSTVRGRGYNELSFEDLAGREEVYLRAQRNLRERVLHDHTTRVGRDQSNHVERDQRERVDRDQTLEVGGWRQKTVTGEERNIHESSRITKIQEHEVLYVHGRRQIDVLEDEGYRVHADRTLKVTGLEHETFGARDTTVREHDNLHVVEGANRNVHVTGQHNIRADERFHLEHKSTQIHLENDKVHVSSPRRVDLVAGHRCPHAAQAQLDADGTIVLEARERIVLRVGSSSIVIEDGRIRVHADDAAMLASPESYVKVGASYAEVKSTTASVEASAIAQIKGLLVKLN